MLPDAGGQAKADRRPWATCRDLYFPAFGVAGGLYCLQSGTTYPGWQSVLAIHLLLMLLLNAAMTTCSGFPWPCALVNFSRSLVESICVSTANIRSGTVWREACWSLRKDAVVG